MHTPDNDLFQDYKYHGYLFSCNAALIRIAEVHDYLSRESYWAAGISIERVSRSIRHSICIGIYAADGSQVGFGRMITDRATFGYLADVYVLEQHRGKGLSKELVRGFCALADIFGLRRFMLATLDAHGLYRQYGFEGLTNPERIMGRPGISYQPVSK